MQKRVFIYQAVDKPFEVCLLYYWEFEVLTSSLNHF